MQKKAMAGQKIPIVQKCLNAWQLYKEHRGSAWGGAQTYVQRFEALEKLLQEHTGKSVNESRVLEVGCGQRAVMPLVFAAKGAEAHGVDVEVPTFKLNPMIFMKVLRRNGLDRAVKSLARHVLFDRAFFKELEKVFELRSLPFSNVNIKVMDAAALDYPDDFFDLVFSFAAFEHVADVEKAVVQVNRILKPDGVALIAIHLFASLSGGHHMEWQRPDVSPSKVVPPWDHLRENKYPANTYLNKLRIKNYEDIFERRMIPVRTSFSREGLGLTHLIPDSLLETYTVKELTTNGVQFILKKKL